MHKKIGLQDLQGGTVLNKSESESLKNKEFNNFRNFLFFHQLQLIAKQVVIIKIQIRCVDILVEFFIKIKLV